VRRFEGCGAGIASDLREAIDFVAISGAQRETGSVGPVLGVSVQSEERGGSVFAGAIIANRLRVFHYSREAHSWEQGVVEAPDLREIADAQVDVVKKHASSLSRR
jgi:hypothetical protein